VPKKSKDPTFKNKPTRQSADIPGPLSWPAIGALFCQAKTDVYRVLVLYPRPPEPEQRIERPRELAAILGARLQRLALVNLACPPSPQEPGVPPMWSIEDFHFRVSKLASDFLDLLGETERMNPAARLKFLRRRLGNLGRKFELYSKAQVIDRTALVRQIAEAEAAEQKLATANGTGFVTGESGNGVDMPKPKVVPINGRKLVAECERSKRFILNVGPDRVAFDWSIRATKLSPKTGDQPAQVLPMKTDPKKKRPDLMDESA